MLQNTTSSTSIFSLQPSEYKLVLSMVHNLSGFPSLSRLYRVPVFTEFPSLQSSRLYKVPVAIFFVSGKREGALSFDKHGHVRFTTVPFEIKLYLNNNFYNLIFSIVYVVHIRKSLVKTTHNAKVGYLIQYWWEKSCMGIVMNRTFNLINKWSLQRDRSVIWVISS